MINSAVQVSQPAIVSLASRHDQIRRLSDRLIEAQKPLRILEPIHWPHDVEEQFFAARGRELPRLSRADYGRTALPFDGCNKLAELRELERDICFHLGHASACSQMMVQRCRDYRSVVELLASRGTSRFAQISRRLFGSTSWKPRKDAPNLRAIGRLVKQAINQFAVSRRTPGESTYDARAAAEILELRLRRYFGDSVQFRLRLTDELSSDASAGGAIINIRDDATFAEWELRLLEVHEGWVHLATTLNGRNQPWCSFLGKNSPGATVTQEGLAILTEILSGVSHPQRLLRLANRIEAVGMAEEGADFLEVYRFYLEQGENPRSSYQHAHRVFRGGLPAGCGPFTKDLGYSRGLIQLLELVDRAQRAGQLLDIGLLFCGKTSATELPNLAQLAEEGIIKGPEFIPPPFATGAVLELWAGVARSVTNRWQRSFHDALGEVLAPASVERKCRLTGLDSGRQVNMLP